VQSLSVSAAHNPNGHTATTVLAALQGRGGVRRFSFRYELLNSGGDVVRELDNVLACTVEQNWLADIKRTAKFRVRDTGVINYLSDLIKPWVRLHLPPYGDGDWVEWPQGVFSLASPTRTADDANRVIREVDAYDLLQVYLDDRVADRYVVLAGTNYFDAVGDLVDGGPIGRAVIPWEDIDLPADREWEPGTPKLRIINDLLGAVNYESLSFDEDGTAVATPYLSPASRTEEYTYDDGQYGVMVPFVDQTLDLFSIPNRWVLVVSEPDRPALVGEYTNNDPASLTSTVRRGRVITDFRTEQEAADQVSLDAKAARLAFEASQVYEAIEFETAIMPIHSGNDVYRIGYAPLAINDKYAEHSWSMELRAGATMRHRARRVVTV
jgi:hypothetical protein